MFFLFVYNHCWSCCSTGFQLGFSDRIHVRQIMPSRLLTNILSNNSNSSSNSKAVAVGIFTLFLFKTWWTDKWLVMTWVTAVLVDCWHCKARADGTTRYLVDSKAGDGEIPFSSICISSRFPAIPSLFYLLIDQTIAKRWKTLSKQLEHKQD